MATHCPYFVKLDEDILQDPEIQDLIEENGFEGLGVYLSILTLFRAYEGTSYMIPFKDLKRLAKKTFDMTEKRLGGIIYDCIRIGILESLTKPDGQTYFYSPRRKAELHTQIEVKQKQRNAAEATNRKRYGMSV